ncbi:ABC transporter ATP-binding protein [Nocardia panacis]|uniref:ABC transporter ATP-binding protein n=1 Tax=Nocardia panacis TaxID=2340916 RepID=A0A3A4KAG9_9NOCA|nr:ATP-binding cassette domain-containing protein [Nocardia panacis]RJO75025.1 ABC transporter ATP-binding protein [Nocardia panacis]
MTPLLEADTLIRSYRLPRRTLLGGPPIRQAVREVSLRLPEGARLGIVGESGSGKSTLLRLLLALDRPDSGTIRFRGRPVRGRDLLWFRREVQVVLQDPATALNPHRTIRDSLAEPLECLRIPEEHDARIAEILTAVGLEPEAAHRYPHQFSGGQRQRIAIARALAPRPTLLVVDEPFSALDTAVRGHIIDLVRDLLTHNGLSLILVSHDLGVVQQLCDQLLVLRDGVAVEQGPARTVLDNPQHPYTESLLRAVPSLP